MKTINFHEKLQASSKVALGSDRSFGLTFAALFVIVGVYPAIRGGQLRWWAIVAGTAFAVLALIRPAILARLNLHWAQFALLVHRVANPIILGVVFFLVITPIAIAMRIGSRDFLRLKIDRGAQSYWIPKREVITSQSMRRQF